MKVIDTHTHLGASRTASIDIPEEIWLQTMKRYKLDGIFSYPLPDPFPDSRTVHDRIYKFAQDNPGRVWGVADINPRCDEEEYVTEATRCVKELGFVAIKLHPYLEATNPSGKHAVKVYETANRLNVPVIVHTGQGAPLALPSMMIPVARKYPYLPIVLAHAGAFVYFDEALIAAQLCDNVYLEMSWCGGPQLKAAINSIGVERLLFGSDGELNVGAELAKAEAMDLDEKMLERYLSGTAIELYKLDR
jgi:predicted TIM-barrel fold metal-dependent hydrolase